ncbi:kinetochore scaffold 1 [Chanos chanos]|uniref:Kinetochore scaffold 1 n=1 Tax=Chanos chanos TaxID=29144 RepID=A0A6J2VPJ9_CHACN|nr:kinetochore scaffold 1 [Chanos chanos]
MTDLQLKLKNAACVVRESAEAATETALPPLQKSVLPETHVNDAGTSKISNAMEGEPAADKADAPESSANLTHHQSTMPKNHREKSLSARLSLGGFLPKLPSRSNPSNANQTQTRSSGLFESSLLNRGADVTREVNNSCMIDNLDDEVLPEVSSEEELSESVDSSLLKLTQERDSSPRELVSMEPEDDSVFEPATKTTQGLKRPFPEDDNEDLKAESKRKQSTSSIIEKWESSVSRVNSEEVPGRMTKNIEAVSSSSSSANLRYESTFESSYKYSQCDSQLDGTTDHEFDFKKKLDDGSITADEFLRHFGINFVIHRSRPSALPENLKSDQTRTMEDLLKEKYIYRPKQRVYETDCQKLTEMVEGLKTRISEQSHPMRSINVSLMRGMSELSKEELQSFGSKLKERKVYFRKRGKSLSHEMKEALYSELVKTTQEAQRNLREKIEEVDGILKDLDECINKLNADLAAKDVILTEDFPTNPDMMPALKTRQQELLNLNTAVAENERQIGELEVQKKATQDKLDLMRKDITGLQSDITVLNRLNEWRLAERNDNRALFTYLHNTLEMELTFQNPLGKDKSGDAERNMDISFHLQLDGEKSQCFAVMVHKLLSQYIQADRKWAEKYPTAGHIPMLLHEVGLVVSRLRLLGEEIHRMKKWGALRLDILELTCVDTLVHIMFSSLKAFVKFEVTLAVTSDYPLSRPQLQTFVNLIGNTRSDQVDKIISSTAPSKNCLTKIVKRIHDELLC